MPSGPGIAAVVMAKRPDPGCVKTRLVPPLTPEGAAALAAALLRDTVRHVCAAPGVEPWIAYAPRTGGPWFAAEFASVQLLWQGAGNLGQRLSRVRDRFFRTSHEGLLLLGADSPFISSEVIAQAADWLRRERCLVVLPAHDGGYQMIGFHRGAPDLFDGIAWSTQTVLAETLAIAERAGLPVRMLSAVPDIDTPDDLDFLTFPLANLPADSRVRAWVASHLPRMGLAPISASPLCEEEASQGAH